MPEAFFDEAAEQSKVKTAIVAKYFVEWARVLIGKQKAMNVAKPKVGYIDLFAGPGRYKDGTRSTPLYILEQAIANPDLAASLWAVFNDREPAATSSLLAEVEALPGYDRLAIKPRVQTDEVGNQIVTKLESRKLPPTLTFIDPFGYKGLSLRLINAVLKDWGCECLFFFNYNRVNMGISNEIVAEPMAALFGNERGPALTAKVNGLPPAEREATVLEELTQSLIEMGGKYVLPFGFKNERGTRTKHYLVFVSKHPLGYKIMKSVMANESSSADQGVPSFDYSPATVRQKFLFELSRPLDDLAGMLLSEFAGRRLSVGDLYESHNYGRRYVERNYKDVLTTMERQGKVTADPPHHKRPKRNGQPTCADRTLFTFPPA